MSQPGVPKERAQAFFLAIDEALRKGHPPPGIAAGNKVQGAVRVAAEAVGYPANSVGSALRASIKAMGHEPDWSVWKGNKAHASFAVPKLADYQATADEIIERKYRIFNRRKKAKDARDLIQVKVHSGGGPVGILHMGDPHLDDDGTNIVLVKEHLELPDKVDGLFRACVGDYLNNWRGKLAPLHAMQSTTQQEAYKLLEWFVQRDKWLYLIAGNHDVWNGNEDPLIWMTRGIGSVYEWHGARLGLRFENGQQQIINVRHDFPGNSQYNRAHGATKAIRFGGTDDLYINGHKHIRAHYEEENSAGGWSHAVQVDSYKWVDDFPHQIGAQKLRLQGGAVMTLHDPAAKNPEGRVQVFWDIGLGVDVLKTMRRRSVAVSEKKGAA
jgi:hypothetical protein